MKKTLSLFLVLMLCIGLIPAGAFADTLQEESQTAEETIESLTLLGEAPVVTTPSAITISVDESTLQGCSYSDGKLAAKKDATFQMKAVDQDGNATPVTWENTLSSSTAYTVDEATGVITVTKDAYGGTGSSNIWIQASSTIDPSVKSKDTNIVLYGYLFNSVNKNKTVALSTDGQTVKTVSLSGGVPASTNWSTTVDPAVAEWSSDPGKGTSVKLNVYRPGIFLVSAAVDFDSSMSDYAVITVTGVAVEDAEDQRTKTYVDEGGTTQLKAYVSPGLTVSSWSSSDDNIAAVDENGLVTGLAAGTVIISAIDSEGTVGGIKVVVKSTTKPYFEAIEFLTSALSDWTAGSTFQATKLEYPLTIKAYSTTKLTMQASTLYDTEKYIASASYTDCNGAAAETEINSGKITYLENIPFGNSDITVTIADKNDAENKTEYVFHVTRPRDTTKVIKSSTGIVLAPASRSLSTAQYNGKAEGTFFQASDAGVATTTASITGTKYYYRAFIIGNDTAFTLTFTGNTAYQRMRCSADDGETWTELPQGGGKTAAIDFPEVTEGNSVAKVLLQVLDDSAYYANVSEGKDGFADSTPNTYTVWVERVSVDTDSIGILTAILDDENAECYPAQLRADVTSYTYIVPNGTSTANLSYTVTEGAAVKVGTVAKTPDESGVYTLQLKTSAQTINVTKDGVTKAYSFKLQARSAKAYADKVVDYLCVNSQYTNISYGIEPQTTLSGTLKSLGNWGGYITYYFDEPLTDDPANKYGMDFYVYGNSQENNIDSMGELGQIWVSEDGSSWYAIAGSEHYEDDVLWDYQVTYRKAENGKTAWTDNQGISNDGSSNSGAWVSPAVYYLNSMAASDEITLSGILMYCQQGSIQGDSSTSSYAHKAKFGYADYYANGTVGDDVNPYVAAPTKANGIDLAWAVDAEGNPVDVSEMEFHYVKVVTASNIWAGGFAEKSTECAGVVRTTAQAAAVGRTNVPTGITVTDGAASKSVVFTDEEQVYTLDLEDMQSVTLTVDGAAEDDNVYINNLRGTSAEGLSIADGKDEKLVRIIVQNGDKEPVIYMLKLTGGFGTEEDDDTEDDDQGDVTGSIGEVKVVIENTTYAVTDGAAWDGVLVEKWVELDEGSTMMSCVIDALGSYTQTGAESGYITEINGLEAFDGGAMSGWMGAINDWFTAEGFGAYSVKKGTLSDGDIVSIMYSCDYGADLGSDWSGSDTSLAALSVSGGTLGEAFEPESLEYTVEISGSSARLTVVPTALNKNFMVKTFLNEKVTTNGEGDSYYKRTETISVKDGDKIYVGVGEPAWPSMNAAAEPTWYVLTIVGTDGSGDSETTDKDAAAASAFIDVPEDAYFAPAVDWAVEKGVTAGIGSNKFGTGQDCTREQMVTFLWNYAGKPEFSGESFSDVAESAYYSTAAAWAKGLGIAAGKGDGSFGVGETVTREQVVTFLWNYAGQPEPKSMVSYSDVPADAYYAKAVAWAKEEAITVGVGNGLFGSGRACTREQIVVLMYKFAGRE